MEQYRTLAISIFTTAKYTVTLIGGLAIEMILIYGNEDYLTYKFLFLSCAGIIATAAISSIWLRKLDVNTRDDKEVEGEIRESWWKYLSDLLALKRFWRLISVIMLIAMVKSVFYQQTTALPLYMEREIGEDSHYGLMVVLNQLIVITLTPFFTFLIYYISAYNVFIIGAFIGCASPLVFLGGANYYTVVTFIVFSSIGESLYAPRIVEYLLETSPKGKESGMIAMTYLPISFSGAFTGIIAGVLMNAYCPEDGETHCEIVWVLIAAYAVPTVVLLISLRKWLEQPLYESNPFVSCSKEAKAN